MKSRRKGLWRALRTKPLLRISVVLLLAMMGLTGCNAKDPTPTYRLIIIAESDGTVTSSGGAYAAGAIVTIEAIPGNGSVFDIWTTGNGGEFKDATSAVTTFIMPEEDVVITAVFGSLGMYPLFETSAYNADIDRDYEQVFPLCVTNRGVTDGLFYVDNVGEQPEDLSYGFSGNGSSADTAVYLQPGESAAIDMVFFAQNAEIETRNLAVRAYAYEDGRDTFKLCDTSTVALKINGIEEMEIVLTAGDVDEATLSAVYTIKNNGSHSIADLTVSLSGEPADYARLAPNIHNYSLESGKSISFCVIPDLAAAGLSGQTSFNGDIVITGLGDSQAFPTSFTLDGKSLTTLTMADITLINDGNPYVNMGIDESSYKLHKNEYHADGCGELSGEYDIVYGLNQENKVTVKTDIKIDSIAGQSIPAGDVQLTKTETADSLVLHFTQYMTQEQYEALISGSQPESPIYMEQMSAFYSSGESLPDESLSGNLPFRRVPFVEPVPASGGSPLFASAADHNYIRLAAGPSSAPSDASVAVDFSIALGDTLTTGNWNDFFQGAGTLKTGFDVFNKLGDALKVYNNPNYTQGQRDAYLSVTLADILLTGFLQVSGSALGPMGTFTAGWLTGVVFDWLREEILRDSNPDGAKWEEAFEGQQCTNRRNIETSFYVPPVPKLPAWPETDFDNPDPVNPWDDEDWESFGTTVQFPDGTYGVVPDIWISERLFPKAYEQDNTHHGIYIIPGPCSPVILWDGTFTQKLNKTLVNEGVFRGGGIRSVNYIPALIPGDTATIVAVGTTRHGTSLFPALSQGVQVDEIAVGGVNTLLTEYSTLPTQFLASTNRKVTLIYPKNTPYTITTAFADLSALPDMRLLPDFSVYPEDIRFDSDRGYRDVLLGVPVRMQVDVYNEGSRCGYCTVAVYADGKEIFKQENDSIEYFSAKTYEFDYTPLQETTVMNVVVSDTSILYKDTDLSNNEAAATLKARDLQKPEIRKVTPQGVGRYIPTRASVTLVKALDMKEVEFSLDGVKIAVEPWLLTSDTRSISFASLTFEEGKEYEVTVRAIYYTDATMASTDWVEETVKFTYNPELPEFSEDPEQAYRPEIDFIQVNDTLGHPTYWENETRTVGWHISYVSATVASDVSHVDVEYLEVYVNGVKAGVLSGDPSTSFCDIELNLALEEGKEYDITIRAVYTRYEIEKHFVESRVRVKCVPRTPAMELLISSVGDMYAPRIYASVDLIGGDYLGSGFSVQAVEIYIDGALADSDQGGDRRGYYSFWDLQGFVPVIGREYEMTARVIYYTSPTETAYIENTRMFSWDGG
ncbi:MAG: hypothetical protein FWG40_07135 [Peptococcaceae bacterium]|nr:hypothetical protein [Peptococcaceae bacterium]